MKRLLAWMARRHWILDPETKAYFKKIRAERERIERGDR